MLLNIEADSGEQIPYILLLRLKTWTRKHTKVYQTPTILRNWKNSLPAPVASWFFHECDVIAMEMAYDYDFDQSLGDTILSIDIKATCYAFLYLTGDQVGLRRGKWYQGEKAYTSGGLRKKRWKAAAEALHAFAKDGQVVWQGELWRVGESLKGVDTSSLKPLSFSGEGRTIFFG